MNLFDYLEKKFISFEKKTLIHISKILTITFETNWMNYNGYDVEIFEFNLFHCNTLSLILTIFNFSLRIDFGGFFETTNFILFDKIIGKDKEVNEE